MGGGGGGCRGGGEGGVGGGEGGVGGGRPNYVVQYSTVLEQLGIMYTQTHFALEGTMSQIVYLGLSFDFI